MSPRPHLLRLLQLLAIIWIARVAIAQNPDSQRIVELYQQARTAYSEKNFAVSAKKFRETADLCAGSELALQCEYFAAASDWARDPCDKNVEAVADWVTKAKKFQAQAIEKGRKVNIQLLHQWTNQSQLIRAQWARQKQRFDQAESLLKSLVDGKDNENVARQPLAWVELGSLLLEQRREYAEAKKCFLHALEDCNDNEAIKLQATWGCALACWYTQEYQQAQAYLEKTQELKPNEDLQIQVRVLQVKIAQAVGDTIDVMSVLEPAIQLALSSNPTASTMYQLALALAEAGQDKQADEVLLRLVYQFPKSPISVEARLRLTRSALEQRQWNQAVQWVDEAIEQGCPKEWTSRALSYRGRANAELGKMDQAQADFTLALESASGDWQLETAIRFDLAEVLYQQQQWKAVEPLWQQLLESAASHSSDSGSYPEWYPVVLLRTAELLALKKEWGQAEQIVLRIRNDFPKCNRACEVDYLFARCLISKAEFESARQVLNSLTTIQQSVPKELVARANWMAGETYLMQRRYAEAIDAYQKVLDTPKQEYWHSAAWLQIGQCCENTKDNARAKTAYQTILDQYANSPFASVAKERLQSLPTSTLADRPNGEASGTKR